MSDSDSVVAGDRVTVLTNDGHRFEGTVVELRTNRAGRDVALLRLDSGWQVTYPVAMLKRRTVEKG